MSAGGMIVVALRLVGTLLGAALVGVGIPAAWIWVGAQIQGSAGARPVAFLAITVTIMGIVASYVIVVLVAGRLAVRRASAAGAQSRRHNWSRSMRGERHEAPVLNSLETVFANAAIVIGVAYIIWVMLFAGSSLPPPGGP